MPSSLVDFDHLVTVGHGEGLNLGFLASKAVTVYLSLAADSDVCERLPPGALTAGAVGCHVLPLGIEMDYHVSSNAP